MNSPVYKIVYLPVASVKQCQLLQARMVCGSYLCFFLFVIKVQCCYIMVNFLENIHKKHAIAHLLEQGVGCILLIQHLIDILLQFL